MGVAAVMSPGTALLAAAIGVRVVAVLAAATAMLAVPSILVLVGPWLHASSPSHGAGAGARLAGAATRRPALAIGAGLLLLIACIPVLGLRTGAPTPQSLAAGSDARAEYDSISKSMGPGWTEPFEIVAVTRSGPVTTDKRLATLERAQRKLSRIPPCAPSSDPARSRAPPRACGGPASARSRRATRCHIVPAGGCVAWATTSTPPPPASTRCAARSRAPTPRPASSRRARAASKAASAPCARASTVLAAAPRIWLPGSRTPGAARAALAAETAAAGGGARQVRDAAKELSMQGRRRGRPRHAARRAVTAPAAYAVAAAGASER